MRTGISARVGAICVAGVLAAVVWIGISGRSAPTAPASEGPAIAQARTPSPSPPAEATATPIPVASPSAPVEGPSPAVDLLAADDFSVVATIGGRQFPAQLVSTEQGRRLSGVIAVAIRGPVAAGTVEFAQVWRTVSHDAWATLAIWDLPLESLAADGSREHVLLDRSVRARPTLRDAPVLLTRGYRITVRTPSGGNWVGLLVDIQIGPNRQLVGNDGIFAWPVVGQLKRPSSGAHFAEMTCTDRKASGCPGAVWCSGDAAPFRSNGKLDRRAMTGSSAGLLDG